MGPVVHVLLDRSLDGGQIDELATWLASTADRVDPDPDEARGWRLYGPGAGLFPPDGTRGDQRTNCQITVAVVDGATVDDPDHAKAVETALGYPPAQCIRIWAGCDQRADHYAVGALALAMAERYDGVIDLLGALAPPDLPWQHWHLGRRHRVVDDPDRRTVDALTAISAYVTSMPGTVHEIYYDIDERQIWVRHLVDIAFLRSWLRHPQFHLGT